MIQKSGNMETVRDAGHVYMENGELFIDSKDQGRRVDWEIASVRNSKLVSVADYYGSETKDITGKDIYALNENVATFYCDEAMQVSNRVSLDLSSGTSAEISGTITSCRDI